jgi:hypothetical protein
MLGRPLPGAHMSRFDLHVVPHGEQWALVREGDDTPVSLHDTRSEAEEHGRQLASDGEVGLTLHPGDGDAEPDDPRGPRS